MDLNHKVNHYLLKGLHSNNKISYEQIHFTGLFLPWHRWYVHFFESALKSKCGFAGATPYWNWSMGWSLSCFQLFLYLYNVFVSQMRRTWKTRHSSRTFLLRLAWAAGETLLVTLKFPREASPTCPSPILPCTD